MATGNRVQTRLSDMDIIKIATRLKGSLASCRKEMLWVYGNYKKELAKTRQDMAETRQELDLLKHEKQQNPNKELEAMRLARDACNELRAAQQSLDRDFVLYRQELGACRTKQQVVEDELDLMKREQKADREGRNEWQEFSKSTNKRLDLLQERMDAFGRCIMTTPQQAASQKASPRPRHSVQKSASVAQRRSARLQQKSQRGAVRKKGGDRGQSKYRRQKR